MGAAARGQIPGHLETYRFKWSVNESTENTVNRVVGIQYIMTRTGKWLYASALLRSAKTTVLYTDTFYN